MLTKIASERKRRRDQAICNPANFDVGDLVMEEANA